MNIKNKVEAINSWQSNRELHPYTCPICQQKLFPAINKKVILNCECGYQQAVPKVMLKRYKCDRRGIMGKRGKREAEMTNIEADLLIAQAEIKSLKGKIENAVKVLDDICKNGCSWEIGSKECVESGCPIAQWRKMEGKEWRERGL